MSVVDASRIRETTGRCNILLENGSAWFKDTIPKEKQIIGIRIKSQKVISEKELKNLREK